MLGCRHVDDVLIDAPWTVSREMVASLKVSHLPPFSFPHRSYCSPAIISFVPFPNCDSDGKCVSRLPHKV